MMNKTVTTASRTTRRISRALAIALSGATLLQAGGCINSLIPGLLSLAEQTILSNFLNSLGTGL